MAGLLEPGVLVRRDINRAGLLMRMLCEIGRELISIASCLLWYDWLRYDGCAIGLR